MSRQAYFQMTLLVAAAILTIPEAVGQEPWKLKPLQFNHPGLTVDLGVGLWAWPMPVDYDRDGDMDLLVACPDKPSNGVYFFENVSQDRRQKMPVFKKAKRIGKAGHNYQVSYVDGKPRFLRPGFEFFVDDATGKVDFSKGQSIYPRANVHQNGVRGNMWRYVDFDGDGDQDIAVGAGDWSDYGWDHAYDSKGEWQNGPLHGFVYLIFNEGSSQSPKYSKEPVRLQAGGGDIDVYGWPSPNFGDFDGDGDLDLLCGEFLDGFTYFENVGTRTRPDYGAGKRLKDRSGNRLTLHLQMITPTAIDWDADGDLDLIVGDEDGRVAFVENSGELNDGVPRFAKPRYFQQEADTLKFGALATPYAIDWDGDGDEDILCGNTAGNIGWFENLGPGTGGMPKWSAPRLLQVNGPAGEKPFRVMAGTNGSIQGPCEAKWGYTTFSAGDWDNDGDLDLVFNSILAKIGLIRNEGGKLIEEGWDSGQRELPPAWYWWKTPGAASLTQWRTTPYMIDFDGDGKQDLVQLDQHGFLTLRSAGGAAQRIFVDSQLQPIQLNQKSCGGSGRVKLTVVDWDGDSRLDLLVNSENALWYRNCETRDGKQVLKRIGNLAKRNVAGHTSSPAVCDFNQDGKPDLLVGAENGRIYHIAHEDCVQFEASKLTAGIQTQVQDQRFAGFVKEEFIYKKASFPQCHASTICQTRRGLVAAWFGGSREGRDDVSIWTSYHDGSKWSAPRKAADGVQHADLRYPCWNPVLFQPPGDAPTLLFFKVGPNPREWWGEVMVSYDRGRTFRDRRRLPEGIYGPVRNKPVILADGKTLLSGSSIEYDGWKVHMEITRLKNGRLQSSWNRVGPLKGDAFQAIQPTILRHGKDRLQILCRTKESVIASSFSADQGKTWSPLEAIDLPNPNSGIDGVTLTDGRHVLIYNPIGSEKNGWGRRGKLVIGLSENGKQWREAGVLEEESGAEFSYPAVIQTDDGKLHITYTWKRQRVKHVVVDPSQLSTGE